MFDKLHEEDKKELIKVLVEKIESGSGATVKLVDNESAIGHYETIDRLTEDVRGILKVTNSKMVLHKLEEGLFINGEIEFHEALDLQNKFLALGLVKASNLNVGEKTFMAYKTINEKYSLMIPKPNK